MVHSLSGLPRRRMQVARIARHPDDVAAQRGTARVPRGVGRLDAHRDVAVVGAGPHRDRLPRPERPEFVAGLEVVVPYYRARLAVRPGMTGLAQVQLPADTDLASVRRKLAYDLYYVRQHGLWLDLRILAGTAFVLLGVPWLVLRKLALIPDPDVIERAYRALD